MITTESERKVQNIESQLIRKKKTTNLFHFLSSYLFKWILPLLKKVQQTFFVRHHRSLSFL